MFTLPCSKTIASHVFSRGSAGHEAEPRPRPGRRCRETFLSKIECFLTRLRLGCSLRVAGELFKVSYETVRRWEKEVVRSGVFMIAWENIVAETEFDTSDILVDSTVCLAPNGGDKTGRAALYRYRYASKIHLVTDKNGLPMTWVISSANRQDVSQIEKLMENVSRMKKLVENVHMDKGYDSSRAERPVEKIHANPRIARKHNRKKKETNSSADAKVRAVVERSFAWIKKTWNGIAKRLTRSEETFDAQIAAASIDILLRRME